MNQDQTEEEIEREISRIDSEIEELKRMSQCADQFVAFLCAERESISKRADKLQTLRHGRKSGKQDLFS